MSSLYHIKQNDFQRVLDLDLDAFNKTFIFATMARINTLYMIAKAGSGHIGSSFSSMDIFSWLYLNVLQEEDVFFSSKGHDVPGLYSVLIGLGKLDYENIHKLRRLYGLPGHPDIGTPCITVNTGSLGMGISKAKGMAKANRLNGNSGRFYVLTGDGELQEGQFWESLPGAVNGNFEEITVIIDHNKIQSDTWVKNVSDLGSLQTKLESYGWHVQRCNGHNLEELAAAVNTAKKVKAIPQIIIADTIKGSGVSFMESTAMKGDEEFYTFHSGAPSQEHYKSAAKELIDKTNESLVKAGLEPLATEEVTRKTPLSQTDNIQKLIPTYEKALLDAGSKRSDVAVLDADLMIDCGLLSFRNTYPERFIECGIAEQDMVSQAGGLARRGLLPIVHSFACFLSTRPNEQIYNNATEKTKIIYTGSLAGILPAGPGHSHQSVRDISCLKDIPGLQLIQPSCEAETKMVLDYCINESEKSSYIRLVTVPCEISFKIPDNYRLSFGKGVPLTKGKDALIFAYGPVLLEQAYCAAQKLREQHDIHITVMNMPWLNYVNGSWLEGLLRGFNTIFTLDDHYVTGGQGQMIAAKLAQFDIELQKDIYLYGINEIPACGTNEEVLKYHGLDAESLSQTIAQKISGI